MASGVDVGLVDATRVSVNPDRFGFFRRNVQIKCGLARLDIEKRFAVHDGENVNLLTAGGFCFFIQDGRTRYFGSEF